MGSHPLNLGLRFLLELFALGSIGYWGWTQHEGLPRWLWTFGLPVAAAVLWGTFAVPEDPSRSGQAPVPIPGLVRLLLELAIFAVGVAALYASQRGAIGLVFAIITILHYILSYDRILWLLKN